MIVNYKLLGGIQYSSIIKYNGQLKTSRHLILFLQDVLYSKKDLLEGAVPHFLRVTQEYCGLLHDLLCKYRDVFPG